MIHDIFQNPIYIEEVSSSTSFSKPVADWINKITSFDLEFNKQNYQLTELDFSSKNQTQLYFYSFFHNRFKCV